MWNPAFQLKMSSVIALWRSVRHAIKWQVLKGDYEFSLYATVISYIHEKYV